MLARASRPAVRVCQLHNVPERSLRGIFLFVSVYRLTSKQVAVLFQDYLISCYIVL